MVSVFVLSLIFTAGVPFSIGESIAANGSGPAVESKSTRHLERLDESKLKRLIHSRHGKALFINVWATWCDPCVEEFPDIVKLSNDMKGKNIDFIGVSGDYFDDESSKVIPFIAKEKAQFKFYIAKLEGEDAFIDAFDKQWGGGMPATFLYDAKGQLKSFLIGKQSYENLKAAVEQTFKTEVKPSKLGHTQETSFPDGRH
jgi:thiol-disulfide isomerase/thioredoxin